MKGEPKPLLLGVVTSSQQGDLKAALRLATSARFDFVVLPLAAPGGQGKGADFTPSVPSDLVLDSTTWGEAVVGTVSDELGLLLNNPQMSTSLDSTSNGTAACEVGSQALRGAASAEVGRGFLETELRWAAHLGLRSVLLPPPTSSNAATYAQSVHEAIMAGIVDVDVADSEGPRMTIAVRVPGAPAEGWPAWNRFRSLCNHHPNLEVALELGPNLGNSDYDISRWLAEPVRFVILHAEAFVLNKHGHPVLPKRHKHLVLQLFKYNVQIVFAMSDVVGEGAGVDPRVAYVAQLFQSRPPPSVMDRFEHTHLDFLQAPLQPLENNLESQTYELFETDPIKYVRYEEAVAKFLEQRADAAKAKNSPICAMVLGAGRGPLVAAVLRAGARVGVQLAIWAVEKNPNAVHTLRHRRRTEDGWGCVEVVAADMREWQAPRSADVIVSELLGSFSDNELSPECLDGAQRFLAEDGVCIPQSYVSSLTPVSAPRVWDDARDRGDLQTLDHGYVVRLHRAFYPCGSVKDCFAFHHPSQQGLTNDRFAELCFEVQADAVVHGFACYFDTELYDGVLLSIRPGQATEGMCSWFPMFIPLRAPLAVRKGETIRSHWWRRHDSKKVWYEWALTEPHPTPIQNSGGRSWAMGL